MCMILERVFAMLNSNGQEQGRISTMYSNKKDSMTVKVHLYMQHQKTNVEALLDDEQQQARKLYSHQRCV